jgi:hypothetical protein
LDWKENSYLMYSFPCPLPPANAHNSLQKLYMFHLREKQSYKICLMIVNATRTTFHDAADDLIGVSVHFSKQNIVRQDRVHKVGLNYEICNEDHDLEKGEVMSGPGSNQENPNTDKEFCKLLHQPRHEPHAFGLRNGVSSVIHYRTWEEYLLPFSLRPAA